MLKANVWQVHLNGSKFTVKADGRDYVFNAGARERALIWKTELDDRIPYARYAKTQFIRSPEYQDALAYLKEGMGP